MCTTCGCGAEAEATITDPATGERQPIIAHAPRHSHGPEHGHDHSHDHAHSHEHFHAHESGTAHGRTVAIEQDILAKNRLLAERNRGWLLGREVLAVNVMGAPGAGKTRLLERTVAEFGSAVPVAVLEGDQATANDAERMRAAGAKALQINTGTGCHLDAAMVARGLKQLDPAPGSILFIENVGNLVCPALFDLGESLRVAVVSITEGEDKPLKYPHMFRAVDAMLLNKVDLLPYLSCDEARLIANARQVNPAVRVFRLSAETGEGLAAWCDWLRTIAPSDNSSSSLELDQCAVEPPRL